MSITCFCLSSLVCHVQTGLKNWNKLIFQVVWVYIQTTLTNWNFSDAEGSRFDSEKTDLLLDIGVVFSESKMVRSTKEKTNFSRLFGYKLAKLF